MTDEDDGWAWPCSPTAKDNLAGLEREAHQQSVTKLETICISPWRDPPEDGEPLDHSPDRTVRIGVFRRSVTFDREHTELVIARIKRRATR